MLLDTLATAWAEAGNFEMAIQIANRAAEGAAQSGNKEVSQDILKRLASFRLKKAVPESNK